MTKKIFKVRLNIWEDAAENGQTNYPPSLIVKKEQEMNIEENREREKKRWKHPRNGGSLTFFDSMCFLFLILQYTPVIFLFLLIHTTSNGYCLGERGKGGIHGTVALLSFSRFIFFFFVCKVFFFLEKEKNHKSERNNADMNVEQQERKGKRGGMRIDEEG